MYELILFHRILKLNTLLNNIPLREVICFVENAKSIINVVLRFYYTYSDITYLPLYNIVYVTQNSDVMTY